MNLQQNTHRKKEKRKPSSQRNLESFQRLRKKRDLKCSRVSFEMHIWIMQEQSCHDKGYCTVALHFLCIEWVSLRCRRNSMDYEHHEWWGSSCTGYTTLPAVQLSSSWKEWVPVQNPAQKKQVRIIQLQLTIHPFSSREGDPCGLIQINYYLSGSPVVRVF